MGKGHRDNVKARAKRPGSLEKRAKRRFPCSRCSLCGTRTRKLNVVGACVRCMEQMASKAAQR